MDRRELLASFGAGVAAVTGGCVADGRVAMETSEEVTVEPLSAWWEELPDVGGNGALSLTVRADQPFDVYYFTDKGEFTRYRLYINNRARARSEGTATQAETGTNGTADKEATAESTTAEDSPAGRRTSVPTGHDDVSQASVPNSENGKYEVTVPNDGGRKDIGTEGEHYLAVDHSNYANGIEVDRFQDPLTPFIDLTVVDEQSVI